MKKLLILMYSVLAIIGTSCKNEAAGPSDKTKKNLEVNATIMKGYASGDFSKMKECLAADIIEHGGENGEVVGVDSVITLMKYYHDMMPDMKYEVIKEVADDEFVFSWTKVTGTMNGQMTTMSNLDVTRFKDGMAAEHWIFMDPNEMMKMSAPQPSIQDSVTAKN